jgi:hypothetical protein
MSDAALTGILPHIPPLLPSDDVACTEILELEIPHETHIKCIIWIRLVLDPDSPIEDYDDVSLSRGIEGERSGRLNSSGHSLSRPIL